MPNKKVINEIEKLVNEWSGQYQKAALPVIRRIIELINNGVKPSTAIKKALDDSSFFSTTREALEGKLFEAAAIGYGITPEFITDIARANVINKLVNLPWAPDKMKLSTRIHGAEAILREQINDTIQNTISRGTNVVKLSRALYEGFDHDRVIKEADLPKYLKKITKMRQEINAMRREGTLTPEAEKTFTELLKASRRNVENGTSQSLKAAYNKLLDKVEKGTAEAVDKAAWVAMQEKSRYYAERIARTELARAWADGFYAKALANENVIAFKWRLSGAHKFYDICDFHAKSNLYGLGPGIYPFNAVPPLPAHPHCTCMLVAVYDGELDGIKPDKDIEKAGKKYLNSLTDDERNGLLTIEGNKAFKQGKSWQDHLRQWQGVEDPASRLSRKDFEVKSADNLPAVKVNNDKLLPSRNNNNDASENEYIGYFMKNFGGKFEDKVIFKDVLNEEIVISNELFHDRANNKFKVFRGRERYLNILADTIKMPAEIWNIEVPTKNDQKRLCRRYISIFEIEGKKIGSLVVFDMVKGRWEGTTSFISTDLKYIDKQRKGIKLR